MDYYKKFYAISDDKKRDGHMSYASLRRTIYTLRRRAFPIIRYGDFLKIITSLQQEYNSKSEY